MNCLLAIFGLAVCITQSQPEKSVYLSDVVSEIGICPSFTGIDTTPYIVWPKFVPGARIEIGKKGYAKGLGVNAPAEILVALDGAYESFAAEVGPQRSAVWPLVFRVLVDGQERYQSRPLTTKDDPQPVELSVRGAKEMRLVVTGGGIGNWADARLVGSASAPVAEPTDMAPFAMVATWDPNRVHGAAVNPVEEFPAADVFLEKEVPPEKDGTLTVPTSTDGKGSIGLEWMELRRIREVGIQFAGTKVPATTGVRVEFWEGGADYVTGESRWQGRWTPLPGSIQVQGDRWLVPVGRETRKIRWVFPASAGRIVLRGQLAHTSSRWATAVVQLRLEKSLPGKSGQIEAYNGAVSEPEGASFRTQAAWDLGSPLRVKVRYTTYRPWGYDRTVLRLRLPQGSFAVAVDDLLPGEFPPAPPPKSGAIAQFKTFEDTIEDLRNDGCVYVPEYGFFATAEPARCDLDSYKRKIAGRRTVLDEVRRMPDQDFGRVLARVYHDRQDTSATMLSLAADNRKFVVERDGTVCSGVTDTGAPVQVFPDSLKPQFGSGKDQRLSRRLDGGWFPIPVTTVCEGDVEYTERAYVIDDRSSNPSPGQPSALSRPLCVVEFEIKGLKATPAAAGLKLTCTTDNTKTARPAELGMDAKRVRVWSGPRLLAAVDLAEAPGLKARLEGGALVLEGEVSAASPARIYAYVPGWDMKPDEHASLRGAPDLRARAIGYWHDVLKDAMEIELPEPILTNLILSSQVHCLMVARNGDGGKEIEPWIASNCYGVLDSESHVVIRGMDFWGHHEFARKSLGYFIRRYTPSGFLVSGYTYGPGMGQHLRTLGEHYQLTKDASWLKAHAAKIATACQYVVRQSEKTRRLDCHGQPLPEYGLLSPGRFADWGHWGYIFSINGHAYAGLTETARALAEIGVGEADAWLGRAAEHREAIRRAYQWMTSRMPVVPLRDGTWVPAPPYELYSLGPIQQCYANLAIYYYDHLGGSHQLVSQGVLAPDSQEAAWTLNHLEDTQFFKAVEYTDNPRYPTEKRSDWFDWGGLNKAQPYYMHYLETYLLRDDVKPFLRAYLNTAAMTMNRENLTFWEGVWGTAAWDKTHETGNFLYQSRIMLVMERGDELWLAPCVSHRWMEDGQVVAVRNAPTSFGQAGYRIESHADRGYIDAMVVSPVRNPPKTLVLRLRHPEGRPIRKVTVNGAAHTDFDAGREIVRLKPSPQPIAVRAEYD